ESHPRQARVDKHQTGQAVDPTPSHHIVIRGQPEWHRDRALFEAGQLRLSRAGPQPPEPELAALIIQGRYKVIQENSSHDSVDPLARKNAREPPRRNQVDGNISQAPRAKLDRFHGRENDLPLLTPGEGARPRAELVGVNLLGKLGVEDKLAAAGI